MRKRQVMSTMASLILTVIFGGTPVVFAEETRCTGTIGARTLDNIVVPRRAYLYAEWHARQRQRGRLDWGNAECQWGTCQRQHPGRGSRAVFINPGSTVGGSVQIKQGGSARISQTRINGDLQLFENEGSLSVNAEPGGRESAGRREHRWTPDLVQCDRGESAV